MYKLLFLFVCTWMICFTGSAQQTFTLEQLLEHAVSNYPATLQKEFVRSLGKENEKVIGIYEYPQLSVTGQGTYQSEVTKFSFPGVEGPQPDNFNIGLDLRYPFTEFDVAKSKKEIEQEKTSLGVHQLDVEIQKLKERITTLFANMLLQNENKKILLVRNAELETQRKKISSAVSNGAILKTNLLVFESEILSTEQKIVDIDATVQGYLQELSLLTGISLTAQAKFTLPVADSIHLDIQRPEISVFQSQIKLLSMQERLLKKENRAKLFVFGQGFYGRPGYDFLNNHLRLYGIAGLGLNWNINNASTQKTKERAIVINQQIVEQQQLSFQLGLQSALLQKQSEMNKYDLIISKDQQIVVKRKEILRIASSQLENGVITSTEYVTELNAENTAELNLLFHQVQRVIARVQYNTLAGY